MIPLLVIEKKINVSMWLEFKLLENIKIMVFWQKLHIN